jgi:hypothetical protein
MSESRSWPWLWALSAALPLSLYVLTASPGAYWLDSGELVASSWVLGVPHPPGHPLYTALSAGAGLLPVGSIALRYNLASGLFGALSCGLLAWVARRRLLEAGAGASVAAWAGLVGALLAGTSYAVWFQSVRAEVYTLHLLTASAVVALGLELEGQAARGAAVDARLLYGLALLVGLGLGNHHYLMVFAAAPVCVLLLARGAWRRRLWSWAGARAAGFGLLGLSSYALLPLRALRDPALNWGDPRTPERLWWVVTARDFQKALGRAQEVDLGQLAADLALVVGQQVTPLGLLLALVGLGWWLWSPGRRGQGLLVAGWVLCNLVTQSLFNFDPYNPDVHGYFGLTAWSLGLLAALSLGALWEGARRLSDVGERGRGAVMAAGVGALAALAALNLWLTLPGARLDGFRDVALTNEALLAGLPEGALVLSSNYKTLFNLWYAQVVELRRPDVTVLHRNFFANAPYVAQVERLQPELAPLMASPGVANTVDAGRLRALARARPVYLEFDVNVQEELHGLLSPEGMLFRVHAAPPGALSEAAARDQEARWLGLEEALGRRAAARGGWEVETRRHLLWQHYQTARGALASGHVRVARFHLGRAEAINPRSPELEALRRSLPGGL